MPEVLGVYEGEGGNVVREVYEGCWAMRGTAKRMVLKNVFYGPIQQLLTADGVRYPTVYKLHYCNNDTPPSTPK